MTGPEAEWLQQIAAGGDARRAAVSALYRHYAARFRGYFQRRGASPADAEELCQDSFVRLVRALDRGTQVDQPRAWIWSVAQSQWLDWRRVAQPDTEDIVDWQDVQSEDDPAVRSLHLDDCVRRQFAAYTAAYPAGAQALLWASVEQFTAPEIGELLGRTPGATRQFLSEARKRVRGYLAVCQEWLDDSS
ncbi:MAG: hypothetical protein CMP06_08245 [Xanthomonadales bacterium]|nr:hypothetical protein [Xanthomonadales bacterium]